jgi:rare lipoprotein A
MLKTKKYLSSLACSLIFTVVGSILFSEQIRIIGSQIIDDDLPNIEIIENEDLEKYLTTVEGISSHYGRKFHKRKTASGERFDMFGYTAAHRRLPFGTIVKVENLRNEKTALVRINDRGPFVKGRIIDISYRAAKEIDGFGIPKVKIYYFDENSITNDFDSSYYLGYSLTNPTVIVRKENVVQIAETSDFEEAMNIFNSLEKQNYMSYYLFIEAGKTQRNPQYIIGYITPQTVTGTTSYTNEE